jgi:SOS-response transcriptional repressor LexA
MKQSTISDLERGRNDSSMDLIPLASALQCRPEWLKTGKGEKAYQEVTGTTDTSYDVNVSPGPDIKGMVPLISWVQAGLFCEAPDLLAPGDAMDWLPCVQKLGPHAYALRVQGDSMTATYGRSYPEGCIIFVDPDCPVTNGCRVIAKIPDANEATFKVYSEDAGKRYLKPLNPQYPIIEMTEAMTLCGVVKGYYMPE